jgi:hypothetical protein
MKVSQLIATLQKLDPDTEVVKFWNPGVVELMGMTPFGSTMELGMVMVSLTATFVRILPNG